MVSPALARAVAITDELYALTAGLGYAGGDEKEDDEIAAYSEMVNARIPLVEELAQLRETITRTDRNTPEFAEIIRTIADIADLDNAHRSFFEQLRNEVRGHLKEIKQGQRINSAYALDITYDDYSRFNKKN
jgi:hypothetical protein